MPNIAKGKNMIASIMGESYYTTHETQLLRDLRQKLPFFRRALYTRFPKDEVERVIQQTQDEFRAMCHACLISAASRIR
jgi:hypothetical protein